MEIRKPSIAGRLKSRVVPIAWPPSRPAIEGFLAVPPQETAAEFPVSSVMALTNSLGSTGFAT
jgi:hypothetical protein